MTVPTTMPDMFPEREPTAISARTLPILTIARMFIPNLFFNEIYISLPFVSSETRAFVPLFHLQSVAQCSGEHVMFPMGTRGFAMKSVSDLMGSKGDEESPLERGKKVLGAIKSVQDKRAQAKDKLSVSTSSLQNEFNVSNCVCCFPASPRTAPNPRPISRPTHPVHARSGPQPADAAALSREENKLTWELKKVSSSFGAPSSADLDLSKELAPLPKGSAPGSLQDEYQYVGTYDASQLDLSKVLPGRPTSAMLGMIQNGPTRGPAIPGDWKAFKGGAPVNIPAMLSALDDIFAEDAKTRAVISDLKTRFAAAQQQLAEAMKVPETPDWAMLARVGGAYPEFLDHVKKIYETEKALKRPSDAELLAANEKGFAAEHADAVALQKAFWAAQDDVMEAVAKAMIEIGEAEELYDRVERDDPVRVDEVLIRRPQAMQTIDKEISEFQFDEESEAKLVNVDLKPLEGFYDILMKAVQEKARA